MPRFRRGRALIVGLSLALLVGAVSVDYTVKSGDTLGAIARDHDVELSDLIEANDIANPNLIFPGQVLVIPGEEGKPPVIYVVVPGDTLGRIAASYDVTVARLAKINGIDNPNLIFPGQEITIEKGKKGSSGGGSGDSGGGGGDDPDIGDGSGSSGTSSRSGKSHIVKRGETLSSIAAQYSGVSVADIERANGIIDGRIYSGTRLFLDGPSFTAGGSGGKSTSYTVQSGDRLGDIAARFGTTISAIAKLNGISDVNQIRSGQVLKIPGGSQWVCPVKDASFFNDWGFPRSGNRYHEGNDIFAAFRAPVRAPVSGKVNFITGSLGGYQFELIGDDGVRYWGSHLDGFAGKDGRKVEAGDVLGYVGQSGNAAATRPHLHFGLYVGALAVNPYPSLMANGCK